MIKSLTIKNFRSYKDEVFFSFVAQPNESKESNIAVINYGDNNLRLLHSAAIFGANASGKSNIVWALRNLSYFITESRKWDKQAGIDCFEPFMFTNSSKLLPTVLKTELFVEEKLYRYIIKYDNAVIKEELYIIQPNQQENRIFTRDSNCRVIVSHDYPSLNKFTSIIKLLPNQLLLSWIGSTESELDALYNEFAQMDIEPVGDSINLKEKNRSIANEYLNNKDTLEWKRLLQMIQLADSSIKDISKEKAGEDEFRIINEAANVNMKFRHTTWSTKALHQVPYVGSKELNFSEESTGTKSMIYVASRVLKTLKKGSLLAYDEMNLALHPTLFKLLVSLFNSHVSNPNNAQLLVTTHDTSICELLRADQIWFSEKNGTGQSELFSAQDFEDVSIIMPFESMYRAGRFGASPVYNEVIENIFGNGKKVKNNQ